MSKDKDNNLRKSDGLSPKLERVETFNQLDERFQITTQDPEHIFPDEYEMIIELKTQRPELEAESDKFLVTFLCARRHDIPETIKLLDKYMKKRKELGLDTSLPTLSDEALKKHLDSGVIILHGVDKHERLVSYVWIAKNKKETPLNILYMYGFWETSYLIRTEPLKYLRNGTILIIDFKGFGLSNVDLSSKGAEFSKALSGMFPKRIRKAYLVNGGWLLKIISEAAKLLLSKKLVDRMEVGNVDGIKNYIDEANLLSDYGGKAHFGIKDMTTRSRQIEEEEKEERKHRDKTMKDLSEDMKHASVSTTASS